MIKKTAKGVSFEYTSPNDPDEVRAVDFCDDEKTWTASSTEMNFMHWFDREPDEEDRLTVLSDLGILEHEQEYSAAVLWSKNLDDLKAEAQQRVAA